MRDSNSMFSRCGFVGKFLTIAIRNDVTTILKEAFGALSRDRAPDQTNVPAKPAGGSAYSAALVSTRRRASSFKRFTELLMTSSSFSYSSARLPHDEARRS